MAPCAIVVQVTLRFSSAKKPLSRATMSGVKFVTAMAATRTLAAAGFVCACAPERHASVAIKTADSPIRIPSMRSSCLAPAAALIVPADHPGFEQQEDPVEHIAEQRQHKDAGIHIRHLESPLRQQRKVAQSVVGHDHL